jgi:hypothetical protein
MKFGIAGVVKTRNAKHAEEEWKAHKNQGQPIWLPLVVAC